MGKYVYNSCFDNVSCCYAGSYTVFNIAQTLLRDILQYAVNVNSHTDGNPHHLFVQRLKSVLFVFQGKLGLELFECFTIYACCNQFNFLAGSIHYIHLPNFNRKFSPTKLFL